MAKYLIHPVPLGIRIASSRSGFNLRSFAAAGNTIPTASLNGKLKVKGFAFDKIENKFFDRDVYWWSLRHGLDLTGKSNNNDVQETLVLKHYQNYSVIPNANCWSHCARCMLEDRFSSGAWEPQRQSAHIAKPLIPVIRTLFADSIAYLLGTYVNV